MNTTLRDDLRRSGDAVRASDRAGFRDAASDQAAYGDAVDGSGSKGDVPFLLVVVDTAGERFSVEGPMIDANEWQNTVYLARRFGDRLACFIKAGSSRFHKARVARGIHYTLGYRHVAPGSIVKPARLRRSSALAG